MTKGRVLAIDDVRINLEIIKEIFDDDIYEVRFALSGEIGLSILKQFSPHVILVDNMMPRMTGIEFCQKVRADDEHQFTPLLMLSANNESKEKERALCAGVNEYIVKPYDIDELKIKVDKYVGMACKTN